MGVLRLGDSIAVDGPSNPPNPPFRVAPDDTPEAQQAVRQCCTLLQLHDLAVFSVNPRIFASPCPRGGWPPPLQQGATAQHP